MRMLSSIMTVVSTLMLLSTVICGFWIRSQNLTGADYLSSVQFHGNLAVATAVVGIATFILNRQLVKKAV